MGGHADDVPDRYADASPIERLPVRRPGAARPRRRRPARARSSCRALRRGGARRPTTRSSSSSAPATTTSSTSTSRAARGRTSWGGWGGSRTPRLADRDVLDVRLAPAGGLEALDPAVEDRPDEDEDLTDQVRDLLLELGRHELAQRRDHRDELRGARRRGRRRPARRRRPSRATPSPAAGSAARRPRGARPPPCVARRRSRRSERGSGGSWSGPSKVTWRLPSSNAARAGRKSPSAGGSISVRLCAVDAHDELEADLLQRDVALVARTAGRAAGRASSAPTTSSCGQAAVQQRAGLGVREQPRRRAGRASPPPTTSSSKYGARSTGTGANAASTSRAGAAGARASAPK